VASQFIIEHLASVLLGICAGLFNAWAAARYGQIEKRYLVGGAASIAGLSLIVLYQISTQLSRSFNRAFRDAAGSQPILL